MNILDKFISFFSPKAAYLRAAYREELERNYDAARTDRFGRWRPLNRSPELTDKRDRDLIKARARDLERNNGIVASILSMVIRNVVSTGIKPQAIITDAKGKELAEINNKIEAAWAEWTKAENCDISGRIDFTKMQDLFLRRILIDGDILVYKTSTKDKAFCLQMFENDALASDVESGEDGNKVYGGVEVNEFLEPVAYHLRTKGDDLNSILSEKPRRIKAENILHGFFITRPQQIRGISPLSVTMESLRHCDEYIDSELKAARISANITGTICTENPMGNPIGRQLKVSSESGSGTITEIDPGTIATLAPGEKADFFTPGRPNPSAAPFVSFILRSIAAAIGLSYEAVSRDLSMVNYSSAREGKLLDIKLYEELQDFLISHLCQPVYEAWLETVFLDGTLNVKDSVKKYKSQVRWVRPGWKWIDPLKEAKGVESQLDLNLTTLQDACGAMGTDWQEIVNQRVREEAYIKKCRHDAGLDGKEEEENSE